MSFQAVQKVRRNTSPLSNRQSGPVKATLSFTYPAVTISGISCFSTPDIQRANNVKGAKKSSPERFHTSSPSSRDRERHTPTAPATSIVSGLGRRTDSTEAVVSSCSNSYLRGEWPKSDPLITQAYFCPSNLTADKASQTPEEWCHSQLIDKKAGSRRSSSVGNTGESLKDIKARLAKTSKEATLITTGSSRSQKRASPVCVIHHDFSVPGKPIAVPAISLPRPASQSSLDGVNQEIERLVLNTSSSADRLVKSPSDGRRAPVAREIKQRSSVLTQTPPISSTSDNRGSPFVLVSADANEGFIDFGSKEDITSVSASPELASFVPERLPPDGCEKIFVKFSEKKSRESVFNSTAPVSTVHLVPSEKSAFNVPLDRKAVGVAYPVPILSGYMKASAMYHSVDH